MKGQGMKSLAGFGAAPQAGLGSSPTYPNVEKPFWQSSQGAKRYLTGELCKTRIQAQNMIGAACD